MKKTTKYQNKYDKLIKKIEDDGLELRNGIIIELTEKTVLSIDASYYLYHTSAGDTQMEDDYGSISLPKKVTKAMKKKDEFIFQVKPILPDIEDDHEFEPYYEGEISLEISYGGEVIDILYLDYTSSFTESWKDYTKLVFQKTNEQWSLVYPELEFAFGEDEHTYGVFNIEKKMLKV